MAKAASVSLSKLTSAVQAAVKSAAAKHPKFKFAAPEAITVSYMIRGIPLPPDLLSTITLAEAQNFADEVASQIQATMPDAMDRIATSGKGGGVVLSAGGHVVCGIPPVTAPKDVVA